MNRPELLLAYLRGLLGLMNLGPLAATFGNSRRRGISNFWTILIIVIIIIVGTIIIYFLLVSAPGPSTVTISYP